VHENWVFLYGGDVWFGKSGFGRFQILVTAVAWGVDSFGWWFDDWLDLHWAVGFFYFVFNFCLD
jgi:hypothetical protein